jgi:hypothetical protein
MLFPKTADNTKPANSEQKTRKDKKSGGKQLARTNTEPNDKIGLPSDGLKLKTESSQYKLAIFPWKIGFHHMYRPSVFYDRSFRAIIDVVKANPDIVLKYTTHRHHRLHEANVVLIDDLVPTSEKEFWKKSRFLQSMNPTSTPLLNLEEP